VQYFLNTEIDLEVTIKNQRTEAGESSLTLRDWDLEAVILSYDLLGYEK
jgi:hypothetical protein